MWQRRVSYTCGQSGCFPWIFVVAGDRAQIPVCFSGLYSIIQSGWMTTLCCVIREYLWPSKEGWVPGDGITHGFLLPDREFLSVVTPMFFHTPTDTTTFLDKEEDDGTQMRERNGLRELGYVGVFLPFGVFSSWISMSDLLETSLGLKCFFSCSTHTKLFWVVLFVFVYNAAEIGWLDIFKIENWCLLREWEEERRTLLAGNMGHTKDNLLLWRLCWIWGGGFGGSWYGGKSSAASPGVPNPLMVLQMLDPNGSCTTVTYLFLFIYWFSPSLF